MSNQEKKDYSNGTNFFYNEGYEAGSGNYDPSASEAIAQGAVCLMAQATKQTDAYNQGYKDGVEQNNDMYQQFKKK